MSTCKVDHSIEDVKQKLSDQKLFLPESLWEKCSQFLTQSVSQTDLNELFHLLKKYDLAPDEEKELRNQKMYALLEK
ncbi:group-specific protein [Peribacillus tepidiphilus]|uniref:group-specific protein n=1 Tax=Peribacillus tepidiphilus TaxID=2652445 RepID=UPI00129123FB|nr:group-specific protein [Peribacillus tepidiphilus]